MKRFIDPCCEKCTHSKETPCQDFIECCTRGPICHESEACAAKRKAIIQKASLNEHFAII
ncbi:MAG TPA: hypothetical protein GX744_06045 [Firmicutes bacterium]|nr:hypothetical protein [Bacillota bacterium]